MARQRTVAWDLPRPHMQVGCEEGAGFPASDSGARRRLRRSRWDPGSGRYPLQPLPQQPLGTANTFNIALLRNFVSIAQSKASCHARVATRLGDASRPDLRGDSRKITLRRGQPVGTSDQPDIAVGADQPQPVFRRRRPRPRVDQIREVRRETGGGIARSRHGEAR